MDGSMDGWVDGCLSDLRVGHGVAGAGVGV